MEADLKVTQEVVIDLERDKKDFETMIEKKDKDIHDSMRRLEDEQVIVSTNRGEPIALNVKLSSTAKAYLNIARRLQGEEVPLVNPIHGEYGLRAKLLRLMQTRIF